MLIASCVRERGENLARFLAPAKLYRILTSPIYFVQSNLYNLAMATKREVSFSTARSEFRALIDEVSRSGREVTIIRHGKPKAVLISYEQYQKGLKSETGRPWTLAGSFQLPSHCRLSDVDRAIRQTRHSMRTTFQKRARRYAKKRR